MNLTVKITNNCLMEMSPALESADINSDDSHYRALAPINEALDNGRRVKGGIVVTLTSGAAIDALRDEARFRAGSCADQSQDAWDNAERLMYLGMKRSFESIVKKCDTVLAEIDYKPEVTEHIATAVAAPVDGPTVIVSRGLNGVSLYVAAIIRYGKTTPVWHLDYDNRKTCFETMAEAQADAESYWAQVAS